MSDTPQNLGVSLVDSQGQLLAELLADNTYQLTPIKGEAYKILNAEGGTTKLADNLIALRSGNDLIIRFANGLEVVMLDYFEICLQPAQDSDNPEAEAQLDCSITVAGDTKEGMTIGSGPASQYELASDASPRIVYAHGDDTALASIIGDNAGMEDIYAAYILSSTAPAVAAATAVSPTLLGAAGLGLGAAAGGGGGGGAAAVAQEIVKISGSVVLGPVVAGHGLTVTAYKADGSVLATGRVNDNGTFTISANSNYSGSVLVRVVDTNAAADYFDEGTRVAKDMDTDLRAATTIAGAGDYTVSVNPLTEFAVQERPLVNGNALNATRAANITAGNESVARSVGLNNVDLIKDTAVPIVDAQGNVNPNANAYGEMLAAISGMEHSQSKTTNTIISNMKGNKSGNSLNSAMQYELVAGGKAANTDVVAIATRLGMTNPQGIKDVWDIVFTHADGASSTATGPTMAQYALVGVTGVDDAEQLRLLNQVVDMQSAADIDTVAELQAYADAAKALMNAAAGNGSEVSLAQLQLLEIGNISASNLSQVQVAIAATADDGTGVDSYAELRVMVNTPAETLTLRHPTSYTTQLKLIKPLITQEGKLYYYYDVSADGTSTGTDTVTHDVLDSWFNGANTVDTQQAGAIAGIDDARTMIIDGYTIVLPTRSELEVIENQALSVGEMGWAANALYWTSTLGTSLNYHYYTYLDSTNASAQRIDTSTGRVVFEVLQNTVIEGTTNADVVNGTVNSEVLKGLAGNDHIHANGGTDMIDAGAGDDHIYINADNISRLDDAILDGGAGTDTMHLIGESLSLDFTDLNNQHVVNIEVIDITGSGDNTLEIKASDVLDMSSTTDILKVIANAGDTVKATDMHDTGMVRTENGVTYKIYAEAGVDIQLWIDENATVVL